jgi:D-glycero-D-manno-heptose 1,7-bisphosphate phosphatase
MKILFLDRDGVINKKANPHDYIKSIKEFEFLPGVLEAFALLSSLDFYVVVVTNQRGIARGLMTEKDLSDIHEKMCMEIKSVNGKLPKIYYCPHDYGDNCSCRKPGIGMLLQAGADLSLDLQTSIMLGDTESDLVAANDAGCSEFYYINDGKDTLLEKSFPINVYIEKNMLNAVKKIAAKERI